MKLISKFLIFCVVGGLSAIIDLLTFNLLFHMGINFSLCRGIAVFLAVLFNFTINRNFTFSARQGKIKKHLSRE